MLIRIITLTILFLCTNGISGFAQTSAPNTGYTPEEILKILDEADTVKKRKGARELLRLLNSETLPLLRDYSSNYQNDSRNRFYAFEKIIELTPVEERFELILQGFKTDKDPTFRGLCGMFFKKAYEDNLIETDSFKEYLWQAINDANEDGFVQTASARTLILMGDKRGKERALQAVLKGESSADFAVTAFETLKSKDIIPALKKNIANSSDLNAQQISEEAVWRIELIDKSENEKIPYLENAIRKSKFSSNQLWAAWKLAEMNNDEAGEALTRLWKSNDPSCRDAGSAGIMSGFEKGIWSREKIESWRTKIK